MRKEINSLTGVQFFHQLVYRYQQERAKRIKPKDKLVGTDGRKLYPTFEWDHRRGFVVEYHQCGLQNPCGTRVMGQNLGPENGLD